MTTSLELAITAIRSGRQEEGRQLLNLLIQQNPNNELAWLWMSSVVNNDEQRARCLYHVLAINPDNAVARRGLQVLGIVISDSRPVKIPRDSQPIKIPKPAQNPQAGPLKALPEPKLIPASAAQRRPFPIDPQAIVDELPFTPVKPPFSKPVQPLTPSDAAPPTGSQAQPQGQTQPLQNPSEPAPVVPPNPTPPMAPQPRAQGQTEPLQHPSEPASIASPTNEAMGLPPQPGQSSSASMGGGEQQARPGTEPVQNPGASQSQPAYAPETQQANTYASASDTGPLAGAPSPAPYPPPGPMPAHETRPTQPSPMSQSNPPLDMPAPGQDMPPPPGGMPAFHANTTMGMPLQYTPPHPSPPASPIHSQATMGMGPAMYPAYPGQATAYVPHPSEPVPVIHSHTTMGMPLPHYLQLQQQQPHYPGLHSTSTMPMPTGQPHLVGQPGASPSQRVTGSKPKKAHPVDEDEEDEPLNVLAVIIFGSLSVTALGGLGMLILLMFTAS